MHKLFKNKKGAAEEMWTVIKFVLGALIFVCAIALLWYVFTGESIVDSMTKKYTQSQLIDNVYLQAETVSIDIVDPNAANPNSCVQKTDYISCKPSTPRDTGELKIYVNVKNTGSKAITVYAKPRIGLDCNDAGKCSNEEWKEGQDRCIVGISQTVRCYLGFSYPFNEVGAEYRIYPGAVIKAQDYYELTGQITTQDVYTYNGKSWLVVKTDR